jgi:hypothetical protein
MKAETWLPIATLILGWGLGLGSELFRSFVTRKRDRLVEQRNTLREVQDALSELFITVYEARLARVRGQGRDEASRRLFASQSRVVLLSALVPDETTKAQLVSFAQIALSMDISREELIPEEAFRKLPDDYMQLLRRLGDLLNRLY